LEFEKYGYFPFSNILCLTFFLDAKKEAKDLKEKPIIAEEQKKSKSKSKS